MKANFSKYNLSIVPWLLEADVSIQYQVYRDMFSKERTDLRDRIAQEGWGARFLANQLENGHWGSSYYQPKWISTHYTLLDLRNLNIHPGHPMLRQTVNKVLREEKGPDGGILPIGTVQKSDVCVNGMFLNFASYFKAAEKSLHSIVDFLLKEHMPDGGFNCQSNRKGAVHSSMHSSISVLEGITEYEKNGYQYRLDELISAKYSAIEFLLIHHLFRSDKTGKIIHKDFLKLSYPSRWKYDILRALDYFQYARVPWDDRMSEAFEVLRNKQNKDQSWNVQAKHPGQQHFEMETAGQPSRWNTLRALRVLNCYQKLPL